MTRARRIRLAIAGVLMLIGGLGFGISIVFGTAYFLQNGRAFGDPGYETYGTGPFGQLGGGITLALSIAWAIVCLAQVACAILLILGRRAGVRLAYVVLPLTLVFLIGFDLPFGYLGLAATAVLVLWPSNSGSSGTS